MEESIPREPELVGRDEELRKLANALDEALEGRGSTVLISGEAGIGKSRLVGKFLDMARSREVKVLTGAAASDTIHPFLVFSTALEDELENPLFLERAHTRFTEIFAVNAAGMLVAQASSEEGGLDADIFAGMLSAVQDFVRDSFAGSGTSKSGLGRLEYGDLKILMEHGHHLFLAAVIKGAEHADMKSLLERGVREIEARHGQVLEKWTGKMEDVAPVQEAVGSLVEAKFLVRRDLEGVKLENERVRIADRVLETLVGISRERPLLLLLEDLHWADESSLFVLNYLARNVKDGRMLLLGTMRPGESAILGETMDKMADEAIMSVMKLDLLKRDSVSALVDEMFSPNRFPPTFADGLADRCEGNPFFIIEMLRQMSEEGHIARANGEYSVGSGEYSIPVSVEDVIHRRLGKLEPEAMALVEYASCIGHEFDRDTLFSLTTIRDPDPALEQLRGSGIMVGADGAERFGHALFQDVIYAGVGDRWRSAYHKNIGEYLERRNRDDVDKVVYELARHFSRTSEVGKAADYCVRAGEKAEATYAPEQAQEYYRLALEAVGKRAHDPEEEAALLAKLGDTATVLGQYERAVEWYTSASATETLKTRKSDYHRKMAQIFLTNGEYPKSMAECETGFDLLGGDDSIEKARLLTTLASNQIKLSENEEARKTLVEALDIAHSHGEVGEKALIIHKLGSIELNRHDYRKTIERFTESLALWEEEGDLLGISRALNSLGIVYFYQGDYERSLEHYRKALDLVNKLGNKQVTSLLLNNIGIIHRDRAEYPEALEYYSRSLEIAKRLGNRTGQTYTYNNLALVYRDIGELDEAETNLMRSLQIAESIGERMGVAKALSNLGDVLVMSGKLPRARDYLARAESICIEIEERMTLTYVYRAYALSYLKSCELVLAEDYIGKAIALATEIESPFEVALCGLPLAEALWRTGRWDEARDELDKSKAFFAESTLSGDYAMVDYNYGLYYKAKGEVGKARSHFEKALKVFEEKGMSLSAEEAREALEGL